MPVSEGAKQSRTRNGKTGSNGKGKLPVQALAASHEPSLGPKPIQRFQTYCFKENEHTRMDGSS
jgi:hypothetical protein